LFLHFAISRLPVRFDEEIFVFVSEFEEEETVEVSSSFDGSCSEKDSRNAEPPVEAGCCRDFRVDTGMTT
jgi:hypothetical protein